MINIIYTIFICCALVYGDNDCQQFIDQKNCILKELITIEINSTSTCSFVCENMNIRDFASSRRLYIKQVGLVNTENVFATIQSKNFMETYYLPIVFDDAPDQLFTSLSEIICPSSGRIFFSITTSSEENVTINFNIKPIEFILPDVGVTVMASPVSPWAKFYKWNDDVESIFLSVESKTKEDSKICGILHVQQPKCPLATQLDEIQGSKGKYQSFQQFGGLTLTKSEFPDGFFMVILPLPTNDLCLGHLGDHPSKRRKTVFILPIEKSNPKYSWISYVIIFIGFNAIIGSWMYTLKKRTYQYFSHLLKDQGPLTIGHCDLRPSFDFVNIIHVMSMFVNRNHINLAEEREQFLEEDSPPLRRLERVESDECLLVSQFEENNDKIIQLPSKTPMNIPVTEDLNPRMVGWWKSESSYEQLITPTRISEIAFSRIIFIIAAFSTIPVYSSLKFFVDISGHKLDTCYFNRRCMISVGNIQDFSKIFTNFGYVIVAVAICHYVNYHEKVILATAKVIGRNDLGVCREYGLFKVLSYELTLQAAMSCVFHLCPNYVTIKFDIIFMYAISITVIGCIWSLRHSDFHQFTYSTFGLIASVLFVAECRIFLSYTLFWMLVAVIHGFLVMSISVMLTKFGTFSFNPTNMLHISKKWKTIMEEVSELQHKENSGCIGTIIKNGIGITINIIMFIVGAILDYDFYMYIFAVLMLNVAYYSAYYLFSKAVLKHERGSSHGWINIILGSLLLIPSIAFFILSYTNYNDTAAQAIVENSSSCLITVFSAHDLWHLFSALSMFAFFTGMLTIDDDVALRRSTDLSVF